MSREMALGSMNSAMVAASPWLDFEAEFMAKMVPRQSSDNEPWYFCMLCVVDAPETHMHCRKHKNKYWAHYNEAKWPLKLPQAPSGFTAHWQQRTPAEAGDHYAGDPGRPRDPPRAVEKPPQTVKAPRSRTMAGNFAAPFADMKGVNEGMERLAARTWDTKARIDALQQELADQKGRVHALEEQLAAQKAHKKLDNKLLSLEVRYAGPLHLFKNAS